MFKLHKVLLIDRGSKQLLVEDKSGQTVAGGFLGDLDCGQNLAGTPGGAAALVYGGDKSHNRRGASVLSWSKWA